MKIAALSATTAGVALLLLALFSVGCGDSTPPPIERPSDIPAPYINKMTLGGPEDDLVIVRSQGSEYVQLNGLVFLWQHGTNLIGVYGKGGLIQATNFASVTSITNVTVLRTNQVQQIEK